MKLLTKNIYYFLLAGLALFACEKEEDQVVFKGGTAPVLQVSSSDDLVLTKAQQDFSSLQFQLTNPKYEFSNGANNQFVYYTLQIDTLGSDFSNPKAIDLAFTRDVVTDYTVKELNTILSGLELKDFEPHVFEFRIKATLASGSVPLYSNVIPITITTYLDVVFPVPDQLFITGAATPKGWMAGGDAPAAEQ